MNRREKERPGKRKDSHRVRRVLESDAHFFAKHHLQPTDVAFAPVRDEDLLGFQTTRGVEPVADGLAELRPPLLGAVAAVAGLRAETGRGLPHRGGDEGRDGFGGVPDPQGDDLGVGPGLGVGAAAAGDLLLGEVERWRW